MANYTTYTNSELEDEIKRLTTEYNLAQKAALENYQLMLELSKQYGEVNDVLETRNGKRSAEKK